MTTYYRFSTPAELAEFVNTFSRQSWNDLHIIEAGKHGIYLPVDQLEQNGLIDGPTEQGIKLVADAMEFDENQLLADQPKAKRVTVKECILNTSLKSRGKGAMEEPPPHLAPDPETEHRALRPVRSGYREVLLAVKKDVADRQSEAKYLQKIVQELASMAVLSFEYAAIERVAPQTGQQAFVSSLPFNYLVRIHNLQFRSFIFRCVHDEELGVYDVLVPWKGTHRQVYVSAGCEWTPAEKSINEMLKHLSPGSFFLVMAPGVREFQNRPNESEMTVCENAQGFLQEPCTDRNGQERYTVTVSQWIEGLKTDRTVLSMPIESETLGQHPQGERDLEICLRLEKQGSSDQYEFRKKRLKAAIRKMQEEAVEAETMEELLGDSENNGHVSLYIYREPNENPYSWDMDSCLRSLLMTYPRDCLYSLLHVRVELTDTPYADDVPGGLGEGTYDLVLDRSLQGREGSDLWTKAGAAEEKDYRPWSLPSEFHPGEGHVFDLENTLYNRYGITVFLPRGFMLRPHMDFRNEHRNKIVDLLCRGAGGQATAVSMAPTNYILILFPKKQGTVGLVVVPKEHLAPLGERFNYFNGTLKVNENIECNPPAAAKSILDAWGGQAVKSLYREKVRGYAQEAVGTLSTLEALHRKIMKECVQYEKDCTALLDEMTATRLACEREIKKWREFVEQMQDWRQACMETVWKKMDSLAAVCEESLNALPEDAEQQCKEKVKNLMKEATERSAKYQKVADELTARMLILLGMKRRR